jgi:hypothetical protein
MPEIPPQDGGLVKHRRQRGESRDAPQKGLDN